MKIYDCFTFYNEFDILQIRLEELWEVVDYFIIAESTKTHQNQKKKLHFFENIERFKKYKDKIRHIIVDDMPDSKDTWVLERYQRKSLERGLYDLEPNDLVIVSDCDEIPRKKIIQEIKNSTFKRCILAMPIYYFKLNYMMIKPIYRQTNIIVTRGSEFVNPQYEREFTFNKGHLPLNYENKEFKIIEHAGWHFTYLGDEEFAKNKIQSFAHIETNNKDIINNLNIDLMIKSGYGFGFEKNKERFAYVNIDEYYPKVISENLDNFERYLIKVSEVKNSSIYDVYPKPTVAKRINIFQRFFLKLSYDIATSQQKIGFIKLLKVFTRNLIRGTY